MAEGNCSKRHHVADVDDRGWWIVRSLDGMGRDLYQYCPAYQDHTLQWGRVENVLTYVGEIEGRIGLEEDNCQIGFRCQNRE